MSCKCPSIECKNDGTYDVIVKNPNSPYMIFPSIPYNVLDAMCAGCDKPDCLENK